jgi:nitrite reductase (NO-forming)
VVSLTFDAEDTFHFSPGSASTQAGGEVEVTLNSVGSLEHTWTLVEEGLERNSIREADAISGANTGPVSGGESKTITFKAPAAGSYEFVCLIPGHAAAGMVGSFTAN